MEKREEHRKEAMRYLQDNAALRGVLGVRDDEVLEPFYLGAGEHNRNFWFRVPRTQERYVLRVNIATQPFHDNQVAYEHAALVALAPSGRVPRVLYCDDAPSALGKGVLVETFCEGDELDFDHLRPGDLLCAAQLMADVHAVVVGDDCPLHRPHDPLRELFEECLRRFEAYRASAFEDARITKWAETFIKRAHALLDTPCRPEDGCHIINTETLPSHFLIPSSAAQEAACADWAREASSSQLRGADQACGMSSRQRGAGAFSVRPGYFIDWERPIIGEVAQDVAYFTSPTTTFWDSDYLFPESEVAGFVEDYWRAVDGRFERGNFDARFRAYRAMTALRSVTWCCQALIRYGGEGGHKVQKTADKLPIYLSDEFMERLARECF